MITRRQLLMGVSSTVVCAAYPLAAMCPNGLRPNFKVAVEHGAQHQSLEWSLMFDPTVWTASP